MKPVKPVPLFDVLGIDLKTRKVRLMAEQETEENAEAVVKMAVMRRGVDREFFASVKAGTYKEGDIWEGERS